MAPYACIAQWIRPLLLHQHLGTFGFQQLPALSCDNHLERQPGDHTPASADHGLVPHGNHSPNDEALNSRGPTSNVTDDDAPNATDGNVPNDNTTDNSTMDDNATDDGAMDNNATDDSAMDNNVPNEWPKEAHTCCSGCVALYKVIAWPVANEMKERTNGTDSQMKNRQTNLSPQNDSTT
ncbi:hypothetical protein BS47DRAFT_1364466 [Hydnum rufescens UP504]|uniref:Uncharacterized protein n=1 Tax=Hydnum rufescens UP504 TaxID=1448309 RepID=A0A9P6ARG9_9AGAM|nr:hypothetical protein BS47DRAFT_1364466 [Hydnum rufescens UP504]